MCDIGAGDFVEAVDSWSVAPGTVARVLEVIKDRGHCENCNQRTEDGLILSIGQKPYRSWCPNHWRPIYRPKSSLIESLKVSTPERVGEPA
jgi:hypothetical protein